MSVTLQPVAVSCGEDIDGLLVFSEGVLVALLVRLSTSHGQLAGAWFLEVGLGKLESRAKPVFPDINAAQEWLSVHLAGPAEH